MRKSSRTAFICVFVLSQICSGGAFANFYSNKNGLCSATPSTAQKAFREGDYETAVRFYTEAINFELKTCKKKDYHAGVGYMFEERAKAWAALGRWEDAFRDVPKRGTTRYNFLGKSDAEWILPIADKILERDPANLDARWVRAKMHAEAGDHFKAAGDYSVITRADIHDKEKAKALQLQAVSQRAVKSYDLALSSISQSIELQPSATRYDVRAAIHEDMGNTDFALLDRNAAVQSFDLKEQFAIAEGFLARRAKLRASTGGLDAALQDYAVLLDAKPDHARYRKERMHTALRAGRDDLAEEDARFLKRLDPDYMKAPETACELQDLKAERFAEPGARAHATEAWKVGEIIGIVPLEMALGGASDNRRKGWDLLIKYVADRAPDGSAGIQPLPQFRGKGRRLVQEAVRFALSQHAAALGALSDDFGAAELSILSVSTAGHMAYALNRRGISPLNGHLAEIIEKNDFESALPCSVWGNMARLLQEKKSSEEVVSAWKKARDSFNEVSSK